MKMCSLNGGDLLIEVVTQAGLTIVTNKLQISDKYDK